jgi:hypothetical protein
MTVRELITELLWYDIDEEIDFFIEDENDSTFEHAYTISCCGGDKSLPCIDIKRRK